MDDPSHKPHRAVNSNYHGISPNTHQRRLSVQQEAWFVGITREQLTPAPSLLPPPKTRCSFETLHNDVQFAILFEEADESKGGGAFNGDGGGAEDGQEEVIVEPQKVESQLGPITGTIPLTRPGRLTLVWDNG